MNEYIISKTYYLALLNELRKSNKAANHRSVVDYLNKTAGILGGVKRVKYI